MPQIEATETAYLDLLKKCLTAEIYDESAWGVVGSRTPNKLKRWVYHWLRDHQLAWVRTSPFSKARRDQGEDWPLFGYTMIGRARLDNIQQSVETILKEGIEGDLIETGVWRGGAVILMRALLKHYNDVERKVWVADSFAGLPKPKARAGGEKIDWDMSHVDYLQVSLEAVKSNFARFGLLDSQVEFLEGWFCDTLPGAPCEKLALLRLDGDLYESTMDALRALYHHVSPGGYVIVDDYLSWPSCREAVDEFRSCGEIREHLVNIDSGGVYWRKDS